MKAGKLALLINSKGRNPMRLFQFLLLFSLGLLLTGCGTSVQSSQLSDEEIVDKFFGEAAYVKYNDTGRVTYLICPQALDPWGIAYRRLLFISTTCKAEKNIPPEIGQLTELKGLSLRGNFTTLPPEIGQLTKLKELSLVGDLTTLPPEIGNLRGLRTLKLNNNSLNSLPPEIGHLTNLRILVLGTNELTTLPPEIGQLINLEKLSLSFNNLTSLPSEIGQLQQLKKLEISHNNLTSLPPEMGQLSNLKYLRMFGTNIKKFPRELRRQLVGTKIEPKSVLK